MKIDLDREFEDLADWKEIGSAILKNLVDENVMNRKGDEQLKPGQTVEARHRTLEPTRWRRAVVTKGSSIVKGSVSIRFDGRSGETLLSLDRVRVPVDKEEFNDDDFFAKQVGEVLKQKKDVVDPTKRLQLLEKALAEENLTGKSGVVTSDQFIPCVIAMLCHDSSDERDAALEAFRKFRPDQPAPSIMDNLPTTSSLNLDDRLNLCCPGISRLKQKASVRSARDSSAGETVPEDQVLQLLKAVRSTPGTQVAQALQMLDLKRNLIDGTEGNLQKRWEEEEKHVLLRKTDVATVGEDNCLWAGRHEFCTLPAGDPNGDETPHGAGRKGTGLTADLRGVPRDQRLAPKGRNEILSVVDHPKPGWSIVSRADDDFDVVKDNVIKPFGWSAKFLAVRDGPRSEEEKHKGEMVISSVVTKNGMMPGVSGTIVTQDLKSVFYHKSACDCNLCKEWRKSHPDRHDDKFTIGDPKTRILMRRQVTAVTRGSDAMLAEPLPCDR